MFVLCSKSFGTDVFTSLRPTQTNDGILSNDAVSLISKVNEHNEWMLQYHFSLTFPFDVNKDSSYQNTCEFLVVVSALVILACNGYRGFTYDLYGDSIS
jgi:hypothetical protein